MFGVGKELSERTAAQKRLHSELGFKLDHSLKVCSTIFWNKLSGVPTSLGPMHNCTEAKCYNGSQSDQVAFGPHPSHVRLTLKVVAFA